MRFVPLTALSCALLLAAAPALADDKRGKDGKRAAKEARKDERKGERDDDKRGRIEEREEWKEARDERKEERKKERKDEHHPGRVGKAATLEAENAKHAERLARIDEAEARAKELSKTDLLERIAKIRAQENKRHERAVARLTREKK